MKLKKAIIINIDISVIEPVINKLNIHFNDDYLASLLKKYYHSK